jgi:hypothetical protein
MKTTIRAKSSSGDPYKVVFEISEGRMTVQCECKAGLLKQSCKHKMGLIEGKLEMLFDPGDANALTSLLGTAECQNLVQALAAKNIELSEVEKAKQALANQEKGIKQKIGLLFYRGRIE